MRKYIVTGIIIGCLFCLLPGFAEARPNGNKKILVHVQAPDIPWTTNTVEPTLVRMLSRTGNLVVYPVTASTTFGPPFPQHYYNVDSLLNWGIEAGGQYLLVVDIEREGLERRKNFHLPLVFHKYQTYGVIEAEIRLLDIERRRFVLAEPLVVELKGPRVFQATMDDDINDPDLHITSPEKVNFFKKLERRFCEKLVSRMSRILRIRVEK